jgi:4-hydroxybutyryl-CoA dehydratase/vinylacetyl-CoA-Delta-isomerase
VEATAKVYELSSDPQYEKVMSATSHLTGQKINRAVHVHRSIEDNLLRLEMARLTSQKLGTCNYRCPCAEGLTPLASVTWEMDQKLGTEYNKRFNEFLRHIQEEDLVCSVASVDAKGDRSKRPLEQDPDMCLRIVEKKNDGIVVRGAKPQVTGAYAADELIVMVSLNCKKGEEDYALIFAVPAGTEGITYICQYSPYTAERILENDVSLLGNPYGQRETAMVIFEDVFVPWERVFLCGEIGFVPVIAERFLRLHSAHSGSCKSGFLDLIIGASQLVTEYTGLKGLPNIRQINI